MISDQWTEPQSPWRNPAELNGVKYLKSHAQVLLDRTSAPDNLWFLTQDYSVHVYNLSSNSQLNWKNTKTGIKAGGGRVYTRHFPYRDVLLV
jgi:hypothetical protein